VIAETFGFEKGIKHRPREAPVFVGVITVLIAIGTIVALIPGIRVIKLLIGVQVVNGVLLPITLFFVWRLASNRNLMGEYANGRTFRTPLLARAVGAAKPLLECDRGAYRRGSLEPVVEPPFLEGDLAPMQ
jgi:Mn2+/Fe2+ NRAMP family transporter